VRHASLITAWSLCGRTWDVGKLCIKSVYYLNSHPYNQHEQRHPVLQHGDTASRLSNLNLYRGRSIICLFRLCVARSRCRDRQPRFPLWETRFFFVAIRTWFTGLCDLWPWLHSQPAALLCIVFASLQLIISYIHRLNPGTIHMCTQIHD
jgi:hypothetical protein